MSETLINRAASAALNRYLAATPEEMLPTRASRDLLWREIARAVIEAMREPTDHMIYEARGGIPDRDPLDYWHEMIDTALNEGRETRKTVSEATWREMNRGVKS